MIIVEEASFVDPTVFYEVIVPLLEVRNTCLLCISTPMGEANMYSELCNTVDSRGVPVFRVIHIGLVCEWCQEHSANPSQCVHMTGNVPEWKDEDQRETVRALYGDRYGMRRFCRQCFETTTQGKLYYSARVWA